LENAQKLSGRAITKAFADLGYKGHGVKQTEVILSQGIKSQTQTSVKAAKRY